MPLPPTLLLVAYARSHLCILEYVWYEIVAYITSSTPLATSMSLKPADLPSTKAIILVPFPILPVLSYEQVICSKLPHYVSIYYFAFSAFAYEQALGCSKNVLEYWPHPHLFPFFNFVVTGSTMPNFARFLRLAPIFFSSFVIQTGSCWSNVLHH